MSLGSTRPGVLLKVFVAEGDFSVARALITFVGFAVIAALIGRLIGRN
jgi:hypothetical protein